MSRNRPGEHEWNFRGCKWKKLWYMIMKDAAILATEMENPRKQEPPG